MNMNVSVFGKKHRDILFKTLRNFKILKSWSCEFVNLGAFGRLRLLTRYFVCFWSIGTLFIGFL